MASGTFARPALVAAALVVVGLVLTLVVAALWCPAQPGPIVLHPSGGFVREGEYPTTTGVDRLLGDRYGSWSGDDAHTGTLVSSAFVAGPGLEFSVAGYPSHAGLALYLTNERTGERLALVKPPPDPREVWTLWTFRLPHAWRGATVRFHADDRSTAHEGWVGVADVRTSSLAGWCAATYGYETLCVIGLLAIVVLAVVPSPRIAFVLVMLVTLLVFRLPTIMSGDVLNPDEAQMTAQAITFLHHPIPWRDFDGTTSGPLNTMFAALPALVGITPNLPGSRFFAALAFVGSVVLLFLALRRLCGEPVARVAAILPLAMFAAQTDGAYVSETLPILLSSVAIWLMTLVGTARIARPWPVAAGGVAIACLPFAKLQAAPVALVLAIVFAGIIVATDTIRRERLRGLAWLVAGMAAVAVVILGAVALNGAFGDFWLTYIVFPRLYIAGNCCNYATPAFFFADPAVGTFLTVAIVVSLAAFIAGATRRRWLITASPTTLALGGFAVLLVAAIYAIEAPQTPFFHYLLWLVIPVAGVAACSLAFFVQTLADDARPRWSRLVLLVAAIAFTLPAVQHTTAALATSPVVRFAPRAWTDDDAAVIARYVAPGERAAMWGWMPQYFIYSGALMGTRDSISQFQIEARPLRDYYRARYLADFRRNDPDVVLEAIGPKAFAYHDRPGYGIAGFPALEHIVDTEYRLVFASENVRIFRRVRRTAAR
jgi:hypothetical protein